MSKKKKLLRIYDMLNAETKPKDFPKFGSYLSSCWVAFSRPSYLWAVLLGVPRHWRFPPASGGHPPRLVPPSGGFNCLAPEVPQKGECRRGWRYFWLCRTRVGFGPATGPTLKTALCHIRALVGRNNKYWSFLMASIKPPWLHYMGRFRKQNKCNFQSKY